MWPKRVRWQRDGKGVRIPCGRTSVRLRLRRRAWCARGAGLGNCSSPSSTLAATVLCGVWRGAVAKADGRPTPAPAGGHSCVGERPTYSDVTKRRSLLVTQGKAAITSAKTGHITSRRDLVHGDVGAWTMVVLRAKPPHTRATRRPRTRRAQGPSPASGTAIGTAGRASTPATKVLSRKGSSSNRKRKRLRSRSNTAQRPT